MLRLRLAVAVIFVLAAAAVPPGAGAADSAASPLYRIETAGRAVLWSRDRPLQSGDQVSFHQHPGGTLVSMRRSDIVRVSIERMVSAPSAYIDVGVTGAGRREAAAPAGGKSAPTVGRSARNEPPGPGARADGTALFNPDRKYQPDIDSKRVPGLSTGMPNSANDYREGRTVAYPAAPATQAAPGEPPKGPQ
ncbi:MAG: hypothetical protein LC796_10590 [Acidobacteria bacterium]|nr:hypothetical protein [Acidobacteriota bacterium]MCA1610148.1 hypothetical protein [Acidobacteriota bacterium]MCA1617265.1 hypothetical protein [Acidobacteriota bacterium]